MRPRVTPGPGQTTATRDQKAKHRPVDVAGSRRETSPAGERKECRSRRPVREGASSQRHQARAPSAPPPTAPADATVQPPRRTRALPHILAGRRSETTFRRHLQMRPRLPRTTTTHRPGGPRTRRLTPPLLPTTVEARGTRDEAELRRRRRAQDVTRNAQKARKNRR